MTLVRRHILTTLALALPAALIVFFIVNSMAARDATIQSNAWPTAHVSVDHARRVRAGSAVVSGRTARRSSAARPSATMPDADVNLPRPSAEQLPFEIFAYDDQILADQRRRARGFRTRSSAR